jgi:hypothetical protein
VEEFIIESVNFLRMGAFSKNSIERPFSIGHRQDVEDDGSQRGHHRQDDADSPIERDD